MSDEPLLSIRDLHVHLPTDDGLVRAVDGVNLEIARGEVVAIVGESGSGKSMTALAILGLVPSPGRVAGEVSWKGSDLTGAPPERLRDIRGKEISMIFQDPMTSLNPSHTIGRQIGEVLRIHEGITRRAARQRAVEVLGQVGIPRPAQRVDSYPHELSGGMRQRAMIAMAVICQPELIIADEPTTALDVTVQAQVLELLLDITRQLGSAVLLITHDLGVVAGTANRVMVMYAGKAAETGTVDDVFYRSHHPYTLGLLASLPRVDTEGTALRPIPGQPPSLLRRPPGCPFHPRCPHARLPAPCAEDEPELRIVTGARADADADPDADEGGHRAACHFAEDVSSVGAGAGS